MGMPVIGHETNVGIGETDDDNRWIALVGREDVFAKKRTTTDDKTTRLFLFNCVAGLVPQAKTNAQKTILGNPNEKKTGEGGKTGSPGLDRFPIPSPSLSRLAAVSFSTNAPMPW